VGLIRGGAASALSYLTFSTPPSSDFFLSEKDLFQPRSLIMPISSEDQKFLDIAIAEAQEGFDEGGIPIGACLVSKNGKVIAKGRNLRMQKYLSSPVFWGCRERCLMVGDRLRCMGRRAVWRMLGDFLRVFTRGQRWYIPSILQVANHSIRL